MFKAVFKLNIDEFGILKDSYVFIQFLNKLASHIDDIDFLEHYLDVIDWEYLSRNPHAIPILEKNLNKVNWASLSLNPNAISILEKNLDKVYWMSLSINPNAIPILENNLDKVYWTELSKNPNAMPLLKKHLDKVNWYDVCTNPNCIDLVIEYLNEPSLPNLLNWAWEQVFPPTLDNLHNFWYPLCLNPSPKALQFLEQNINKINWYLLCSNFEAGYLIEKHVDKLKEYTWPILSKNPSTVSLLECNFDKINWINLSSNTNAIHLLEKHSEILDQKHYIGGMHWWTLWDMLASNKNAVNLLKNNLHKLSENGWLKLGNNPNVMEIIGKLNIDKMKENCREFSCELAEKVFNPLRLMRLCETYGIEMEDYLVQFLRPNC